MRITVKFFRRLVSLLCEVIFVCVLLVMGGTGFLLWKFSDGPVDMTFAAGYIKEALTNPESGQEMSFDGIVAEWPEFTGPILLGMSGVELRESGKTVLEVPRLGVQLAKLPFLIGEIRPEAIIVTEPTIRLFRESDNNLHLLVTDERDPAPIIANPGNDRKDIKKGITLQDIGNSFFKGGNLPDYPALAPLSGLQKVSVRNAHIIVDDYVEGVSWDVSDAMLDLDRRDNNFNLYLSYSEPDGKGENETSTISLTLDREDGHILLSGKAQRVNSATLARIVLPFHSLLDQRFIIDGEISGRLASDWSPLKLEASLSSDKGDLRLEELYEKPLAFSNLAANISLDRDSGKIRIDNTHLDVNGRTIALSGERGLTSADEYFPLTVSIDELDFATIHDMWPESGKGTVLADWMTERLSGAKIKDLKITLPVNPDDWSDIPAEKITGSMSFENLKADYRAPMIPVTEAKGTVTLEKDVLDVKVSSAKLSDMKVKQAHVSITFLTHPTEIGDVTIDTDIAGPLSTVLDYIGREPISLGEKIGLKPADVKGNGDLKVGVVFPALKDLPAEQVKVTVAATLYDILLPGVVRGLDLSGGPFKLDVKGGAFEISGAGKLAGRPIDLTYGEYINPDDAPYSSKIKAALMTDEELRHHFGINLDDFVSGAVPVEIDYLEDQPGNIDIDASADLTPARMFVMPLDYLKKEGVTGRATATARIRNGDIRSVDDLNITVEGGSSASGRIIFGKLGKEWDIVSAKFSKVKLGKSNDFKLDAKVREGDVLDIAITGKKFDARPFIGRRKNVVEKPGKNSKKENKKEDKNANQAVNATVTVDRIIGGEEKDQYLLSPKVTVRTDRAGDIAYLDLSGRTENGQLTASLKPDAKSRMALEIFSDNAGEALHALDIYDRMVGGKLQIKGTQISGGGINDIRGRGMITDFTLVRAPILAKFINLFSLSGLSELLQNKGIGFSKLKTDFEWKRQGGERMIYLKDGRTAGSSIGLSFSGTINQTKDMTDIEGTVVPMSQVNSLVSKVPLLGKLLGGSSGGLIAATYTMKGPGEDPAVFINPLSVLTPGFLRSFLFEGDNDFESDRDGVQKHPAASKKPRYNQ